MSAERELLKRLVEADDLDSASMRSEIVTHLARKARALLAQPERKPQWSDQPPTVPGWYWYRFNSRRKPEPHELSLDAQGILRTVRPYEVGAIVSELDGQWAGPLTQPEE